MAEVRISHPQLYLWPKIRQFLGGYVSGVSLTLIGHPFDTLKVLLQTDSVGRFNSVSNCVSQTLRSEGMLGFSKGMSVPLVMNGLVDCALFGIHFNTLAVLERSRRDMGQESTPVVTSMQAGVVSGALTALVVTPMEGIKTRLQVQYVSPCGRATYSSPMDCLRTVYAQLGVGGVYRGHAAVTLCRCIGTPSYFGAYALFKSNTNTNGSPVSGWRKMLSVIGGGGVAGIAYWLSCYPIDVVKNRLQAAPDTIPPRYPGGMLQVAREIYLTAGLRGFFVGFGVCMVRSMPANIAAFAGYEAAMSILPE